MRSLVLALVVIAHSSARAQRVPTFVTAPLVTLDSVGDTTRMSSRFTDAKRLSDGRVVAAVCRANELRSYDATGKRLGTISLLESGGPQRMLWRLFPAGGDTLGAYESLNVRVTLIDPSFKVARTVAVPNPDTSTFQGRPRGTRLDVVGRFTDGTYIGRVIQNPTDAGGAYGIDRRAMSLYHFDESGRFLDSVSVPGPEMLRVAGRQSIQLPRLGRATTIAVSGDRLLVGDQTFPSVAEYGANLKPLGQVETITRPTLVNDSIRAAWIRIETEGQLTPTNGVLSVYAVSYSPMTPAFRDLVTGADGRIWVQDPQGADHYPMLWTAYKSGQPVARAELPPRFYPTQFGPDWVLGLAFDTTRVDRLALLRLTPGALQNLRLSPKEAAPANRPVCGAFTSR
jgi:hypothetical protein